MPERPGERTCARDGCGRVFVPKTSRRIYCSGSCRALAAKRSGPQSGKGRQPQSAQPALSARVPALIWEPPSEPRESYKTNEPCSGCGAPLLAEPRGIWRACPTCKGLVIPPGVVAPYAAGTARQRQVKSQRERDLEALGLAERKGIMLAQLRAIAEDDRLDPASMPVVEWFREQVRDAASGGRLDELAALLPEAGIRRRRWWQGKPAAITAGYDDGEPGDYDDDDQADEPTALCGVPASDGGHPRRMTWAEAVTASGWRLVPVRGGCQLIADGRPCTGPADRDIGTAWVCGACYGRLGTVIWDDYHRRTAS